MNGTGKFSGLLVVAAALLGLCGALFASGPTWAAVDAPQKAQIAASYEKSALYFIENRGQADKQVKTYARGRDYTFSFTSVKSDRPASSRLPRSPSCGGAPHPGGLAA